jgi:hypothetical protein
VTETLFHKKKKCSSTIWVSDLMWITTWDCLWRFHHWWSHPNSNQVTNSSLHHKLQNFLDAFLKSIVKPSMSNHNPSPSYQDLPHFKKRLSIHPDSMIHLTLYNQDHLAKSHLHTIQLCYYIRKTKVDTIWKWYKMLQK